MQNAEALNADQIGEFLKLSQEIKFTGQSRAEVYRWVQRVLVAQEYAGQGKNQRGAIRAYIAKVTGRSLPQVTRLIRMYRTAGTVEPKPYRRRRFPRQYTDQNIALLAEVDRAHERLSGPATRCILKREYEEFGKLFVQTEIICQQRAILCTRRPRSKDQHAPWMFHVMVVHGADAWCAGKMR
jgi:transposase